MNVEYWRETVGSLAVLATVLQSLSGIPVCKQYVTNKTTSESPSLPFICGFISCTLWLGYGFLKQDNKIVLVNIVGATMSLAYTGVFYKFTVKKKTVLKQLLAVLIILGFVIIYSNYETDQEVFQRRLGSLACSLTLIFVAAPLSKLFHVLKVKSSECLPFPMIVMAFVVSTLWFVYGVLIEDPILQFPNIIAAALSMLQLSLFVLYPRRSPAAIKSVMA